MALPDSVIAAPDFSQLLGRNQVLAKVSADSGRTLYSYQLSMATQAGLLTPTLIAGRQLFHLDDIEAFAKKWGERRLTS